MYGVRPAVHWTMADMHGGMLQLLHRHLAPSAVAAGGPTAAAGITLLEHVNLYVGDEVILLPGGARGAPLPAPAAAAAAAGSYYVHCAFHRSEIRSSRSSSTSRSSGYSQTPASRPTATRRVHLSFEN